MRRRTWSQRGGRRYRLILLIVVSALCGLAGCGTVARPPVAQTGPSSSPAPSPADPALSSSTAAPAPSTAAPAPNCAFPQSGFDCDFQQRFAAVQRYIAARPGTVGVVVRDRQTGAVWRNSAAGTSIWTESTIKLAMAVDLLVRDNAGTITLTAGDRSLIQRMLHTSDDNAADSLWFKYAGADHMAFNRDFSRYGMTSLQPERGYSNFFPYWGFQKDTPDDLDRLVDYVLTQLPDKQRKFLVDQLSAVDPDQQWGVWAAGPAAQPGNKDGWGEEDTGWVMNTVGWVGPDQRYTLVVMNNLNRHGGYDEGRTTNSHIAQLLFGGRPW